MTAAGDAAKWTLCRCSATPARESEQMLGCCWAIVRDIRPALKQHWLTIVVVVGNYVEMIFFIVGQP